MLRLSAFALLLAPTACATFNPTVVLEKPELQKRAEKKFPIAADLPVGTVRFENPEVFFDAPTSRVGLDLDTRVGVGPLGWPGKIAVLGRLKYESGTLYLTEPEIVRLAVPGLPDKYQGLVRDVASASLIAAIPTIPIHEVKGTKKLFVRDVEVHEDEIHVRLGL